jgi:hypothetical protein
MSKSRDDGYGLPKTFPVSVWGGLCDELSTTASLTAFRADIVPTVERERNVTMYWTDSMQRSCDDKNAPPEILTV